MVSMLSVYNRNETCSEVTKKINVVRLVREFARLKTGSYQSIEMRQERREDKYFESRVF